MPTAAAVVPPGPLLAAPRPAVHGYATTWSNAARSSRVSATARRLDTLTRIAALESAPHVIVVDDAGARIGLDFGGRYELRDRTGKVLAGGRKPDAQPIVLWANGALVGNEELAFGPDGAVVPPAVSIDYAAGGGGEVTWAVQVGATDARSVVETHASHYMEHAAGDHGAVVEVEGVSPGHVAVVAASFTSGRRTQPDATQRVQLEGGGAGAIGSDGRVVVALTSGRVAIYDGRRATADGGLPVLATSALAFAPSDVSIVEGGIAVMSGPPGPSAVHMLDDAGKETWSAAAPFAVTAPPIDAGRGRVYLAGAGLAAAENGKIVWSMTAPRVFATALADGSALAAVGAELRVVKRDGTIGKRLRAPDGEELVTPPAVAADGTVWIASGKSLFFAR